MQNMQHTNPARAARGLHRCALGGSGALERRGLQARCLNFHGFNGSLRRYQLQVLGTSVAAIALPVFKIAQVSSFFTAGPVAGFECGVDLLSHSRNGRQAQQQWRQVPGQQYGSTAQVGDSKQPKCIITWLPVVIGTDFAQAHTVSSAHLRILPALRHPSALQLLQGKPVLPHSRIHATNCAYLTRPACRHLSFDLPLSLCKGRVGPLQV